MVRMTIQNHPAKSSRYHRPQGRIRGRSRVLFKKKERQYSEAYLEVKGNRIIEEEKRGRVELGDEPLPQESEEKVSVSFRDTPHKESAPHEGPDPIEEKQQREENQDPRPKGWRAVFIFLFWTGLTVSSVYAFVPQTRSLLQQPLDYPSPFEKPPQTSVSEGVVVDGVIPEAPVSETPPIEVPTEPVAGEDATSGESLPADSKNPFVNAGKITASTFIPDTARFYSDVHRHIVESTDSMRSVTQQYIDRTAAHVQMTSLGGRIQTKSDRIRLTMSQLEAHPIQANLLQRLDNLDAMSQETQRLTRETAFDAINPYLIEENTDRQAFIDQLVSLLESEGRPFSIEDGVIHFD